MSTLTITIDSESFGIELLTAEAPESVEALWDLLPLTSELVHVRWSGYATWIDIDDLELPDLPRENHTAYPSRGDVLLYPGYRNEQEILLACGPTNFKSPAGELAGNHVGTIDASRETLAAIERRTLTDGALDVEITDT